jgi:leucyl aminopeptidase
MNFQLKTLSLTQAAAQKTDALLVLVPEGYKPVQALKAPQDDLNQVLAQALARGDLQTKAGKWLALHRPAGVAATRVLLAGVGEGKPAQVKSAVNAAWAALRASAPGLKTLSVVFAGTADAAALRACVLALSDAGYVYSATKKIADPITLDKVTVGVADAKPLQTAFKHILATASGVAMAKEWANRPGNHATPTLLANAAKGLASAAAKLSVQVLGPKEVEKLGMGSFMAVAQGSSEPLRFIVLNYQGAAKTVAPTVLVGKGITFDTGGISIKPAAEMDEMKFDMAGAASVLGVFKALGELQPKINVVGLIPAAENMPGGQAIKPGDVVKSMSGQTIEILNTDAEGRLVLCDALTYAERFKPKAVIDIATLTGACVISLGAVRSGLFATKDELAEALLKAGEAAQDLAWRLPLDEDYAEGLKSNFADVANVGGRAGGAITAAKFLQRFATQFDWAHLDIAGTAWKSGAAKGATGRPVGLLLSYLLGETA